MYRDVTLRRSLGWLAGIAAAVLTVLALVVGVARLLLPLVPEYQAEIRRFANQATGLDVEFARLSASWPFQGPTVRFFDVHVRTHDGGRKVLDAEELSVGVSLLQFVTRGRLLPGRVGVKGAQLRVERAAGGEVLINGVPLDEVWRRPPTGSLPRLDLQLAEVRILAIDRSRLVPQAGFLVNQLDAELSPSGITFEGELDLEPALGRTLELAGTVPASLLPGGSAAARTRPPWSLRVAGNGLELGTWLRLVSDGATPLQSGQADIDLRVELAGLVPQQVDLDLDVTDGVLMGLARQEAGYRQMGISLSWTRDAAGWRLGLERLALQRGQKSSPATRAEVRYTAGVDGAAGRFKATADVLRLADLYPLAWATASAGLRGELLPQRMEGEVRGLEIDATLGGGLPPRYIVRATLAGFGMVMPAPGVALTGLTGKVSADQLGGRLDLNSQAGLIRLPELFRRDIVTTLVQGGLAWRYADGNLDLIADDLRIATVDGQTRSRLHLTVPREGSPVIDLRSRIDASSAPAVVTYLPLRKFKPAAIAWLDRAIVAGRVRGGELIWQGPVRAFPYEQGDGRFRVEFAIEDGVLDYAPEWPRVEQLSAKVVIDRVTLVSAENRGVIAGLPFEDADVRVSRLAHDAELELADAAKVPVGQVLGFLQQSPVAGMLGPALDSVVGAGDVTTEIRLVLPIASPRDYRVTAVFEPDRASLGLTGVEFGLTDLTGALRLDNTRLSGDVLKARFLDEPVSISLRPARADEPGLAEVANFSGTTPIEKLTAAFSIPFPQRLDGNVNWRATALVPTRQARAALRVLVDSDLRGLTSSIAAPLDKVADTPEPLHMNVSFPERGVLDVEGRLQRGVSWALRFLSRPKTGWKAERGAFRSGSSPAILPARAGLEISGSFRALRFEDWYPGRGQGQGKGPAVDLLRQVVVDVDQFSVFGRLFRAVHIDAERGGDAWTIGVHGPAMEGSVTVPVSGDADAPVVIDMQRLWLKESDPAPGEGGSDPRNLPPVRVNIQDFALNEMHFGRLAAEMNQRGDGVVVEPLRMESKSFKIRGDAAWVVENADPARQRSELRIEFRSTDIRQSMEELGYDPVIEGARADVDADLFWAGGPDAEFLNIAGGRVTVMMENGQFLAVEPGSGRVLGLLSVAALPRRLGLDFRDVVDKGLAFDEVKGEFRLDGGNAFTCNLGLEGPSAELGIVGRAGLKNRDYDQLAVVRSHVSDVFALGGAVVGGPVVGGAVLLISQIFRKPLSSLGVAYYRLSGGWDTPNVNRVQRSDVDITPFRDCERYFSEALRQLPGEAAPGVDGEHAP